jgi:hypothetical protein
MAFDAVTYILLKKEIGEGTAPHIGENGNWFIGDTDTGVHAQGPQGPQGNPGPDGQDGITPHIDSTTGNWFIGNVDTGIHAQGPQGNPGQDGQDGLTTRIQVNGTTYTQVGGLITLPNYPSQVIVDQTYNAGSSNAQSGTAVAQAIASAITTALNTPV